MIRVVIDTNVFVSSFFSRKSPPFQVISLWRKGSFVLCLSSMIIDEYLAVLRRFNLEDKPEYEEFVSGLKDFPNIVFVSEPRKKVQISRDPHDNKFIDCAIHHKAKFVITGDKDLLSIKRYFEIQFLTPREFLDLMFSSHPARPPRHQILP